MRVLICGGGVVGASTAYFLSRQGVHATVIERTGLACAASGKSGGFLALDWCDGTPLEPLARRSFALHEQLTAEIGGEWGYRRMTTYGGSVDERRRLHRPSTRPIEWLSDAVTLDRRLGGIDTTAQVHPGAFTDALMRAAEVRGATLLRGRVTGMALDRGGSRILGVEVDGRVVPADAVVVAMGPWSILATAWLPLPRVFGLKGHSLVFDTGPAVPAEAVFLEYEGGDGMAHAPEVFPRSDGTTYVCGISSESPLPIDPGAVAPDPGAIERLQAICGALSPALASAPILASQACYRPVVRDGLPLMGAVPGVAGAYVATGHSVWGILNAPATGEAMAELILNGEARVTDLSPFDPARLSLANAGRSGQRPRD